MNSAQLWIEPRKKRAIPPQVFVAAGLLAVLLLGSSTWEIAKTTISPASPTFFATKSR
jgi:hypothetical protein